MVETELAATKFRIDRRVAELQMEQPQRLCADEIANAEEGK
jgi:hypothetical protein